MGHRLTKIYTKTGDDGSTGLADGTRISKDDPQIEAIGDIDELNSVIGMLLAYPFASAIIRNCLTKAQHWLFDLGGQLAYPQYNGIQQAHIEELEAAIDQLNNELPPLKEFILPKGNLATTTCHLARSVCRRAERRLITSHKSQPIMGECLQLINRLSDFLFVAARTLAQENDDSEVMWNHIRKK